MSVIEIRNRLRAERRSVGTCPRTSQSPDAPVIAFENQTSHRLTVSVPARRPEVAGRLPKMLALSGRLVEAEHANRNRALWSKEDLEFGLPSVANGPLNWIHEESRVIGTLLDPTIVDTAEAAKEHVGPYIRTNAVAWQWVAPQEVATLADYLDQDRAWLSMECVAESIQCTGDHGCGEAFDYELAQAAWFKGADTGVCEHITNRASVRRMVNPTFRGAAVIVPPARPGWANADLRVRQEAEQVLEAASFHADGVSDAEAAHMVSEIVRWSSR